MATSQVPASFRPPGFERPPRNCKHDPNPFRVCFLRPPKRPFPTPWSATAVVRHSRGVSHEPRVGPPMGVTKISREKLRLSKRERCSCISYDFKRLRRKDRKCTTEKIDHKLRREGKYIQAFETSRELSHTPVKNKFDLSWCPSTTQNRTGFRTRSIEVVTLPSEA